MNPTPTPHSSSASEPSPFRPPLTARPWLFYAGLGAVALWCLVLVAMFLTTVYPHPEHDPHRRPETAAQSD